MKTFEGLQKLRIACPASKCKKAAEVGPDCVACDKAQIFVLDDKSHVVACLIKKEKKANKKAVAKNGE